MSHLLRRACALAVALALLGGCASELWDALFPRDLCAEIRPILPSPRDTADTLRQVAAQTALIHEVCAR
jgi:hypothetical protein